MRICFWSWGKARRSLTSRTSRSACAHPRRDDSSERCVWSLCVNLNTSVCMCEYVDLRVCGCARSAGRERVKAA